MARYTGPKHKLARREGINIIEKESQSLERRLNIPPGQHGRKGRKKLSEYGLQLREKQKLKRIYGVLEKQFRRYVMLAQKKKGDTQENLLQLLETRLDNIVYRLGFAKSRAHARQLVVHKHVLVNGKTVNVPSFQVKVGDKISLKDDMLKNSNVSEAMETKKSIPAFLQQEKEGKGGKLTRLPKIEDVSNPVDYYLVIEYYSR
jgi:small subunit ribosomal protein S4